MSFQIGIGSVIEGEAKESFPLATLGERLLSQQPRRLFGPFRRGRSFILGASPPAPFDRQAGQRPAAVVTPPGRVLDAGETLSQLTLQQEPLSLMPFKSGRIAGERKSAE